MKKFKTRFAATAMVLVMVGALLGGCANDKGGDTQTKGEADTKDIVKLKWYMSINPVATDTEKVIAKLNEYTKEKIGVEIDYKVMANPDYKEKMPTYINSGEDFDICFTSNWTTSYAEFSNRDAFMDLTELLPKHAKETYKFLPDDLWNAIKINGKIYGVPSYKELGWQGSIYANTDMAEAYGIDLSKVKTLQDYTEVLKTVKEKSQAEGKNVTGISGLDFHLGVPYESLTQNLDLPGASAVPNTNLFGSEEEVFNQYATKEYMDYCKLVHGWYQEGYISKDPVQYDTDIANRDNDFNKGTLFSYMTQTAPGAAEMLETTAGHGVTAIDLMQPVFETRSVLGGLLAVSSGSKNPEKALELINLLNTDKYVGTLIRHGIEGEHHTAVGEEQVDRTMGGKLDPSKNGYDYTFGWQFGTPFNQKWDISYPENIDELFEEYNQKSIVATHNGFSPDTSSMESAISAVTNVIAQYAEALEKGMVNPEEKIPEFLKQLDQNGAQDILKEIRTQLKDAK